MDYEIRQVPWTTPSSDGKPTYYQGDNVPIAVVLHKMQGWVTTAIGWAVSGAFGKSWHFSIRLDGVIYQHLSYTDGGYHAGITDSQARNNPPTWTLWKGTGINVNTYTIGIELEGFSGNAIPPQQREALKWLLHKICTDLNIRYDRDHLPPHADIDTVNRVNDFDYPAGREELYIYLLEDEEVGMTAEEKALLIAVAQAQVGYATGIAADGSHNVVKELTEKTAPLVDNPLAFRTSSAGPHEHTVTGVAQ